MLRVALKRTAQAVGGTAALGVTGVAAYASTEQGQGLKRELQFWKGVAPVVVDYYWHFASSSPLVKYQKYIAAEKDDGELQRKEEERQKMKQLHKEHAPDILQVLLDLKGLYIKLGQVLSVTALPVPESYREQFRTLQSDVPGWETFEDKVKPVLERELGQPVEEIFSYIDPVPCGAASIGQAHKAVLKETGEQVIIKVQYPDAAWQIPADIQCVGDFLKLCVFFGLVEERSANMSFNEFSRQFIAELDYNQERQNLQDVYKSTLDPEAPYQRRGVLVPHVYKNLCTSKIITMSYLPGPKLEEEARRQLEALGINTKNGLRGLVRAPIENEEDESGEVAVASQRGKADEANGLETDEKNSDNAESTVSRVSLKQRAAHLGSKVVSVDALLSLVRLGRRIQLWFTATTVQSIKLLSAIPLVTLPSSVETWISEHSTASQQAKRLELTKEWIDALFDVHAHQVFNLGCFNADAHPGNILVVDEDSSKPKLGLIDFGQCKRLTQKEQYQIARLLVSVANKESDHVIADSFRDLGIETKNNSTEYLAKFAKLMFGPLEAHHLNHDWHKQLHEQDQVQYFPSQLSMVYRTSMLLRGLAMSLQFNVSVGDLWKDQAEQAIERYKLLSEEMAEDLVQDTPTLLSRKPSLRIVRRMTTKNIVDDLQEHTVRQ